MEMVDFELRRPSAGTILGAIGAVLGFAALIVSLSGSADARPGKALIGRGDIAPGAVTAKALAPGAVHGKAIAPSAVTAKKLASGAVNRRVLGKAAVIASSIAPNAVTRGAIAPGSVYGGALGEQTIHTTPIADMDEVAENGKWTAGNTEVAFCGASERLLGTGFVFSQQGNNEVTFLQVQPFIGATNGTSGRMATNSGGNAQGQIIALCLK